MKYIKTAILDRRHGCGGDDSLHAEARRSPISACCPSTPSSARPQTDADRIPFRHDRQRREIPALRSIVEAANAGYFFELEEFGGTARQAADSALRQIAAELAFPQNARR